MNADQRRPLSGLSIEKIGFDRWVLDQVDTGELDGSDIARVTGVHKDRYTISDGQREIPAELVGKMAYGAASSLDFPTVGDWVATSPLEAADFAVIHRIFPRKSLLKRKTAGRKIGFQLLAANIDAAFVMQSADGNFNINRLERYLVMVNEGRIAPIVLLSKSDLAAPGELAEKIGAIGAVMPEVPVHAFSNLDPAGVETIRGLLMPGRTHCLLGSSGVGKTTLLNNLTGGARFSTDAVREKDGKGRHTTTSRHLIRIHGGAMIVDTPGMRELGIVSAPSGLEATYAEIAALAANCRFNDCTHTGEKGCAVLKAVDDSALSRKRVDNFLRISRESEYNQMSYLQKRRKDRQLGKFYKSVLKQKTNRW
jgi:ribosome biogenesis GTPase